MKNKIKEFRIKRGMSQTELARKSGISRQSLFSAETRNKDLTMQHAVDVSKALGVSLNALFDESSSEEEPSTKISVDTTEIMLAQQEVEKLVKSLEKANSLIDKLASKLNNDQPQ